MRRFRTTVVLALATLLSISICSAQQTPTTSVPNLIRYSGTLKDAQGAAPSSSTALGVTFSIYKQQDGGAAVWMETQNVTPDSNGQYSVILGSTTATGLPDDLFSQQEQRWLGVQIQGQAEQVRVLLVSVPYAFKAHEAETLGGLPASAFVKAPPTDGSGNGSTGADNGTSVNALSKAGKKGGSADSGGIQPKTVSDCLNPVLGAITLWSRQIQISPPIWELCNSNIFQVLAGPFTGNIGIGPFPAGRQPSEPLDVWGRISTYKWYDINEQRIVSVDTSAALPAPGGSTNLFLGWNAAGPTVNGQNNGAFNTFTGNSAGFRNNGGFFNTYTGEAAGFSNAVGLYNTMLGFHAGYFNTDNYNTCVGSFACYQLITGGHNTMVGSTAGLFPAIGAENSFFGDAAGSSSGGNQNTFAGVNAGQNNRGDGNAFFGYDAGYSNVSAFDGNSFFGYKAGLRNTTGYHNTFIGYDAGMSNTSASNTTFGRDNTFVGYKAGMSNTISAGNTFVGTSAGQLSGLSHPVDCCNTYIGDGSGRNAQVSNSTFVGYRTGEATTTGDSNTFVGTRSGLVNVSGRTNSFFGTITGEQNVDGSFNTFLGEEAGHQNINGSFNTYVGFQSGNGVGSNNSSNIEIRNLGGIADAGFIRIGTQGAGQGQQHDNTYIAGIYGVPIINTPLPVVIGLDGHLGTGGGGSGVMGGCTSPSGGTYLTLWTPGSPSMTVRCSFLFQQDTTNFIGIGTTNPSEALDVAGDISANPHGTPDRSSYQIGETTVLTAFGSGNTVVGFTNAHATNTGTNNTFVGAAAGTSNNTGARNTFVGSQAGQSNNGGFNNTFVGWLAGVNTDTGNSNTFVGLRAGQNNASGVGNSFYGRRAGTANITGTYNLYLGTDSDENNAAGHNNIYLSNPGAAENNTIRIGGSTAISGFGPQTVTYIVGIYNSTGTPTPAFQSVCVDSNGLLYGTTPLTNCMVSSRRFKEQIRDMADSTSKLLQLRPVTFFYKPQYDDGSHALQFGLIAEEVAKVYPDMVAYDKEGQPYTVKYQMLTPMLLNELQKQHTVVAAQQDVIKTQQEQLQTQGQQIADLQERLSRLESLIAKK
jgi:hypothetical protein